MAPDEEKPQPVQALAAADAPKAPTNGAGTQGPATNALTSSDFEVVETPRPKPEDSKKSGSGFRAALPKPALPPRLPALKSGPMRTSGVAPLPPLPEREGPPAVPRAADPLVADAGELVQRCESELTAGPEPTRAAHLHYEIARLCENPLGDLRRAATHYQEALALLPEHLPSLQGARRVLLARSSAQAALPLFDAEVKLTADVARKAALLHAKGRLLEDALARRKDAREAYMAALALSPTDAIVLKALERLDAEDESWRDLAKTYEQSANAVVGDPRHRSALLVERARLLEMREGELDTAAQLYAAALELDPQASVPLDALKRLYRDHKRWGDLVAVLAREAAQTSDPVVAAMAHYQSGRVQVARLGKLSEGIEALERAAAVMPDDALLLKELGRLNEEADRHAELTRVLARLAEVASDRGERLDLLHRLGQIHELELKQEDEALIWYERALALDATFVPALRALSKHYTARRDWKALIAMYLAEAEASTDLMRKANAHARAAELIEEQIGDQPRAAEHHARALGFAAGHAVSFKALTRLYRSAGQYRELVELLERAIDTAETPQHAISYLFQVGQLYEDTLGQHAQAVQAYRRVLALDPSSLGAIQALQRAAERAGRYADLVEALELEASKASDPRRVVALRHRAGEVLHERLGDRETAIRCFKRVLEVDRGYIPALASLGRIYYQLGRWEDLLETYRQQLEVTPRGSEQVVLLHKMGELSEERQGDEEGALAFYKRAIGLDPGHLPSLSRLAYKLERRRDWAELLRVLQLQAKALDRAEARAEAAYRMGEICEEHLQQPDRAISAYAQALETLAGYRPAFDALTRLRATRHAWARLVEDLEREAEQTRDPRLKVAALLRQGEVWRDALRDPKRAIACFERVLEVESTQVGALIALEMLYAKTADWAALASLYSRQAEVFGEVGAKVAALHELSRIHQRADLGDADGPRKAYMAILELRPRDRATLEALERLALDRADRKLLAEVEARLADAESDPSCKAAHLVRLAESLEALGVDGALDTYQQALDLEPDSLAAARGIARLAQKTGNAQALVDGLRREATLTHLPERAAELLVRCATVRRERLEDKRGAIKDLERALERCPEHLEAATALARLLRECGELGRLADLLSQAATSTRGERSAVLWGEVARLYADDLSNLPGAIAALNRVLKGQPDHIPTLRQVSDLYTRDGQWTEAVRVVSRIIEITSDRDLLVRANLELAALHTDRLNEPSRAAECLKAALALDADNPEALSRLADQALTRGDTAEALSLSRRLAGAAKEPETRAGALLRVARAERSERHVATALQALREAVALEGPGGAAAAELEDLVSQEGGWQHYAEAIQRFLATAESEGRAAASAYVALAKVQGGPLEQPAHAVATLRRALAAGKDSPELRSELAARLRASGRSEEAVAEARKALPTRLTDATAWRTLAEALADVGKAEEARLALAPVALFGAVSPEEETALERRVGLGRVRRGAFAALQQRRFEDGNPSASAIEAMLGALSEGFGKLVNPHLDRYGVTARDRVDGRADLPLAEAARGLAAAFGVEAYELYLHSKKDRGFAVEPAEVPAIVVPADLARLSEAKQIFLLARPFAYLARNAQLLYRMTPQELELLLVSAARIVEPTFGFGQSSEEFLNQQHKRIVKALSRRARKALEEAATTFVGGGRPEVAKWVGALDRTAARSGMLLADDLRVCVGLVKASEPGLAALDARGLYERSERVKDLVDFWGSDAANEQRRRAGLLA